MKKFFGWKDVIIVSSLLVAWAVNFYLKNDCGLVCSENLRETYRFFSISIPVAIIIIVVVTLITHHLLIESERNNKFVLLSVYVFLAITVGTSILVWVLVADAFLTIVITGIFALFTLEAIKKIDQKYMGK